jgi:hypothetical protein
MAEAKAYCVQAQVVKTTEHGSKMSYGIPTFYLFRSVQGIVSQEHAERIVRGMLNPLDDPTIEVHPNCNLVPITLAFEED